VQKSFGHNFYENCHLKFWTSSRYVDCLKARCIAFQCRL